MTKNKNNHRAVNVTTVHSRRFPLTIPKQRSEWRALTNKNVNRTPHVAAHNARENPIEKPVGFLAVSVSIFSAPFPSESAASGNG